MKISLLILSWWCLSCLHIQKIGIQYTDQLFWKIIPYEQEIWFSLTNFYFLFFYLSDLRNFAKCVDSMVSCYSLLNMKVIWLHMVSPTPTITMEEGAEGGEGGDLVWKFANILWRQNFFLHLWQDKSLWVELKAKWGSNIYYYITTLSLFHFFRNSQHSEK